MMTLSSDISLEDVHNVFFSPRSNLLRYSNINFSEENRPSVEMMSSSANASNTVTESMRSGIARLAESTDSFQNDRNYIPVRGWEPNHIDLESL